MLPSLMEIVMINQLVFCTPDLGSNVGSNVGAGMFKDPSLIGNFPLPPPSPSTAHISPINMISSFTSGSLESIDPWVVPHPEDVDSYGSSMLFMVVEVVDPKIPSKSTDTGQQLHSHMECDQPTPPKRVVD
jgi:hypothetical protein